MKRLILTSFLVASAFFATQAQSLEAYTWDKYGFKFSAPTNTELVESNEKYFEVDNEYMNVSIKVYTQDFKLVDLAKKNGISFVGSEFQDWDGNGFFGMSLEGTRKGKSDNIICARLKSKKSNTYLYVEVIYGDGFEKEANDVINSFKMTK